MAKNHILKFRVSKWQRERIEEEARVRGYVSIAAYLRDLALGSRLIDTKIIESNKISKELLEEMKWMKKNLHPPNG